MSDPITAHGRHVTVTFDGRYVNISRSRPSSRTRNTLSVPVASISSLRWEPAAAASPGFLRFALAGSAEDGCLAAFNRAQQPAFEALKDAVLQAIGDHQDQVGHPEALSKAEELTKLATLLQQHVLTPDEFTAAKARLLS
jgi:hypothetical protein